jgi:hypothetical protein
MRPALGLRRPSHDTIASGIVIESLIKYAVTMKKLSVCFAILGFLGASAFYSPYIGLNHQFWIECPVCPHVTTIHGSPLERFFRLAFVMGLANAALFAALGSLGILCGRAVKWMTRGVLGK